MFFFVVVLLNSGNNNEERKQFDTQILYVRFVVVCKCASSLLLFMAIVNSRMEQFIHSKNKTKKKTKDASFKVNICQLYRRDTLLN